MMLRYTFCIMFKNPNNFSVYTTPVFQRESTPTLGTDARTKKLMTNTLIFNYFRIKINVANKLPRIDI